MTTSHSDLLFRGAVVGPMISENKWHRPIIRKGRPLIILTEEYRLYLERLAFMFRAAMSQPKTDEFLPRANEWLKDGKFSIQAYYSMSVTVWLWKMKDTGNQVKALQDGLERAGVIENDRQILDVHLYRKFHKKGEEDMAIVELYLIPPSLYCDYENQQKGYPAEVGNEHTN